MTTEENIALIRRGLDAFSHGDFEAASNDMDPGIEWHISFRLPDLPPDKDVYHGPAEIRKLWAAFRSAWESLTVTLEEVIEAHDETVVARAHFIGRASAEIEVDRSIFYVYEITNRKLKRIRPFDTKAEALSAAHST